MKKGELSRLRFNVSLLAAELDEKDKEIERLKAEIEVLKGKSSENKKALFTVLTADDGIDPFEDDWWLK